MAVCPKSANGRHKRSPAARHHYGAAIIYGQATFQITNHTSHIPSSCSQFELPHPVQVAKDHRCLACYLWKSTVPSIGRHDGEVSGALTQLLSPVATLKHDGPIVLQWTEEGNAVVANNWHEPTGAAHGWGLAGAARGRGTARAARDRGPMRAARDGGQ